MPFSRGALHDSFRIGPSRHAFVIAVTLGAAAAAAVMSCTACGSSESPSPFVLDRDGGDAAPSELREGGSAPAVVDAGRFEAGAPGEWGGSCLDDGQCSDGIDCTADRCDVVRGRCHFAAVDS